MGDLEADGQISVYDINTGAVVATYEGLEVHQAMLQNKALVAAVAGLLQSAKNALADLEGILPEYEPSGDREHPAWQTIEELKAAIAISRIRDKER